MGKAVQRFAEFIRVPHIVIQACGFQRGFFVSICLWRLIPQQPFQQLIEAQQLFFKAGLLILLSSALQFIQQK